MPLLSGIGTPLRSLQVAGLGLLDTISISNASVILQGVTGVTALSVFTIGNGGTLTLASSLDAVAVSSFTFTGDNSRLVLGHGIDVSLLGASRGFGRGRAIDFSALASSLSNVDGGNRAGAGRAHQRSRRGATS